MASFNRAASDTTMNQLNTIELRSPSAFLKWLKCLKYFKVLLKEIQEQVLGKGRY